jgi:hypothetical protein
MTRTEFVRAYAIASNKSARLAPVGCVDCGDGFVMVAIPCACGEVSCPGWAMLSPETLLLHLEFSAPEPLRSAYLETVKQSGGV